MKKGQTMKYLKVGITKTLATDLYVAVPDDFVLKDIMRGRYREELGTIALETTQASDWDDCGWEKTVEVCEVKIVPESEAMQFLVGCLLR